MIKISEVSKSYGAIQALRSVSLEVQPGEVFGLLGANGSGKTTLNRCITTLVRADSGQVVVNGCSLDEDPEGARRAIGYLAEFPVMYPMLTAEEFLSFVAGLRGLNRSAAREQMDRWIQLFELDDARSRRMSGFSHGQDVRRGQDEQSSSQSEQAYGDKYLPGHGQQQARNRGRRRGAGTHARLHNRPGVAAGSPASLP